MNFWEIALESFKNGEIVTGLLQAVLAFCVSLVSIILAPINALIEKLIPSVSSIATAVQSFYDLIIGYMSWIIDALAIPKVVLVLISGYVLFSFSVRFSLLAFKIVMKWKKALFT